MKEKIESEKMKIVKFCDENSESSLFSSKILATRSLVT
jgi:hypothetical protein